MGALTLEYSGHVASLIDAARDRGEIRRDVPVSQMSSACFAHYAFWIQGGLGSGLVTREQAETNLRGALTLQIEGMRASAEAAPAGGLL